MRRIILILVLVALIGGAVLTYHSISVSRIPSNPFSANAPITSEQAIDIAAGDSAVTIANASPFYAGAHSLAGQNTQAVDNLRAKKVEELVATSAKLADAANGISGKIDALEKAYLDYLDIARKKQSDLAPLVKQSMLQLTKDRLEVAGAGAFYRAIPTASDSPHCAATVQYAKVVKSMQYGLLTLRRMNDISTFAAIAYNHGSKSTDPKVKQALQTLDSAMSQMDSLSKTAKDIDDQIGDIRYGLRQIETCDYYYARAAVDFMQKTLPDVQAKLRTLQPSTEMPAAQLKMARDFADDLQADISAMQGKLDAVDKTKLVQVAAYPDSVGCAYAENSDQRAFQKAALAYLTPHQREEMKKNSGGGNLGELANATWEAVKRAPGVAVDMTELQIKNVMRRAMGLYYGSSQEDTEKDVTEYANEVDKHFRENTSGSQVFRTAKDGMNYLENTCQQKAEEIVSGSGIPLADSAIGTKITGLIAKGTVSVLTGFSKGVYALCDPTSTKGELAEGSLEIACSMFGGSKMLPTPKMLGNGAQQLLGWAGSKIGGAMINMAESTIGKKTLYEEVIRNGAPILVNFLEKRIGYATTTILKNTRASLKEELLQMTKAGLFAAGENAKEVAAKSLYELARKEFTMGLSGLAESLGTMYGTNISEFMATMTGQTLDDMLKALVKEALDGNDGTYTGNLSGTAGGSLTLVLSGSAAHGSISGTYQGDGFTCRLNGSVSQSGAIDCQVKGSLVDSNGTGTYSLGGSFTGCASDGKATGTWSASNQYGGSSGGWSAARR